MDPRRSPERSGGRTNRTKSGGGGRESTTVRSKDPHYLSSSASAMAATSSASVLSSARRAQYVGGEDRFVLDLGAWTTKVGHSNEIRPRAILRSLRHARLPEQPIDHSSQGLLWSLDLARCKDDVERNAMRYRLTARIRLLLRHIFYQTLIQDPKARKVVILQNAFMPTMVQEILQEVLFDNLRVTSVAFVPHHLMAAVAIGRMSCMVIDIGYEQTSLVPIHLWRPLVPRYLLTSTKAARRISHRLRALLLHFATFVPRHTSTSTGYGAATSSSLLSSRESATPADRILAGLLEDEEVLDEIKAKALTVGAPLDYVHSRANRVKSAQPSQDWKNARPFSEVAEESDVAWMTQLRERYDVAGTHNSQTLTIDLMTTREDSLAPAHEPATLGLASHPPPVREAQGTLVIPGWIRERAIDVLFEQGDEDEPSLTEMVLDALLKLPVDLRRCMANNIYLIGGTAMLPGLAHRLRLEVVATLQRAGPWGVEANPTHVSLEQPKVGTRIIAKRQIAKQSFVSAHPEGVDDTFVTTDEGEGRASEADRITQQPSRHAMRYTPLTPLLSSIAVINDHAPRLDAEGNSVSRAAPAFPVNTVAWTGASLIHSLRIESRLQTTKEEHDIRMAEQQRRQKEASQVTTEDATLASQQGGRSAKERPGLGMGRGSFLGSVGGLDLGTYGPLSSGGTRARFSGGPGSPSSNARSP